MPRIDPHSYYDDAQPRTSSWTLRLRVDFARKVLSGTAELRLATSNEARASAASAYDLALGTYRQGTTTIVDLLSAAAALAHARALVVGAQADWYLALAQLRRDSGGAIGPPAEEP